VFTPSVKELNYFSPDIRQSISAFIGTVPPAYNPGKSKYNAYFEGWENKTYALDISPMYLISKQAAYAIYQYNPQVKIIAIFREPVSFMQSAHGENHFGMYDPEPDFFKALSLETSRIENPPKTALFPAMLQYRAQTEYATFLQQYLYVFPSKLIGILFYEEFKLNNQAFFDRILQFLALETAEIKFETHSSYRKPRFPALKALLKSEGGSAILKSLKSVIPKNLVTQLNKWYGKVETVPAEKQMIRDDIQLSSKQEVLNHVVILDKSLHQCQLISESMDFRK
jgi:hypothetical protein